ncbi:DNA-directed DNA polymerase eta rad30 [Pleurotus pulmonarius]|nr:DNA-directed DNA polymerase eta rad30 [Pleurotus pulmonarius]
METETHPLMKGKSKLLDTSNTDSIHQYETITYRHLLSQTLGSRDPLRVIALCDSDAFYAACEMVRLGTDPELPLVVQQWDSLIAVNYPARKFGISRMDKVVEAKKKCPELICVHVPTYKEGDAEPGHWGAVDARTHKTSLDTYRTESGKILSVFKEELPGVEIEKASIDEAFFDLTRPVREALLRRYPHLVSASPKDMDTPLPPPPPIKWDELGHLIPIEPQTNPTGEREGESSKTPEAAKEEPRPTWHDVALSIGAELMAGVREKVRTKLGYTTSAGIARNKFLAKLTASYRKFNSQSILRNAAIPNYLKPMPFQKIRFLGGKLGKAIAEEYDASTVGDLLCIQNKYGESALWVWEILRGIDRSEVKAKTALFKSMSASKNLLKPLLKPAEGAHWIRVLAADLVFRLKAARAEQPTLWPKTLVLGAFKGYGNGHSKQAPLPFIKDVSVDIIASVADKLWKELLSLEVEGAPLNIRHMYMSFTGVGTAEVGQGSIEGFLKSPAAIVSTASKRKPHAEEELSANEDDDALPFTDGTSINPARNSPDCHTPPSFTCPRCGKTISFEVNNADAFYDTTGTIKDREARLDWNSRLDILQREHEDYHYALDLTRRTNGTLKVGMPGPVSGPSSKKKRKPESRSQVSTKGKSPGIERFFNTPKPVNAARHSLLKSVNNMSSSPSMLLDHDQILGAGFAAAFSVLATCAIAGVVFRVAYLHLRHRVIDSEGPPSREHVFFRTQLGRYALCLLLGNFCISLAGLFDLKWLAQGVITSGPTCVTQGVIMQIGNFSTAYFSIAIAVHTFLTLVLHKRQSMLVCGISATLGWIVAATIALSPLYFPRPEGPLYGPSGLSCGIRAIYAREQFLFHLLPIFTASVLSALLHSLIFLVLRGTLMIRGGLSLNLGPPTVSRGRLTYEGYHRFVTAVARSMLWYPFAYVVLLLPYSIVRLLSISGFFVSFAGVVLASVFWSFLGIANVGLLYNTFRVLGPTFDIRNTAASDSESFDTGEKYKTYGTGYVTEFSREQDQPPLPRRDPSVGTDARIASVAESSRYSIQSGSSTVGLLRPGADPATYSLDRSISPATDLNREIVVGAPMSARNERATHKFSPLAKNGRSLESIDTANSLPAPPRRGRSPISYTPSPESLETKGHVPPQDTAMNSSMSPPYLNPVKTRLSASNQDVSRPPLSAQSTSSLSVYCDMGMTEDQWTTQQTGSQSNIGIPDTPHVLRDHAGRHLPLSAIASQTSFPSPTFSYYFDSEPPTERPLPPLPSFPPSPNASLNEDSSLAPAKTAISHKYSVSAFGVTDGGNHMRQLSTSSHTRRPSATSKAF